MSMGIGINWTCSFIVGIFTILLQVEEFSDGYGFLLFYIFGLICFGGYFFVKYKIDETN